MNSKAWINKLLTVCLSVAILATYTTVTLASQGKAIGDLTVSGKSIVTVNGETAQSGRTLFSSSVVKTTENSGAILNMGKFGKLEVAANSTLSISADENGVAGELAEGKVTSLSSNSVIISANGKATKLNAGESVAAGSMASDDERDSSGNCQDTDKDGKLECSDGGAWWIWTLAFAGAAAGILIAVLSDNNRAALGGGTTVTSPSR